MSVKHYTYRVIWSEEDQEHIGLCTEVPSLSWLDADMDRALHGIIGTVAEVVADMQASGENVPSPMSDRTYCLVPNDRSKKNRSISPVASGPA